MKVHSCSTFTFSDDDVKLYENDTPMQFEIVRSNRLLILVITKLKS